MIMKFYNTFKRNNGDYVTQEWSASEMFNFEFVKYIIYGLLLSFLSIIASGICLIVRLINYDEDERGPLYIGIITSLYFLIDYWQGWLVSWLLKTLHYGNELKSLVALNFAMLITHIMLLVFGDTIYYNIEGESERKYTLVCYSLICLVVSFFIGKLIA